MNQRIAGCLVVASVAGLALLPACAARPATKAAAPEAAGLRLMDLSQIPPLQSAPVVYESAFASGWSSVPPSAEDLAYHAMLLGTDGLSPGEVAGGPKEPLPAGKAQPAAGAPSGRPKLVLRSLQPDAAPVQTEGEEAWKKSLPPLPHLAGK
jgi:hypothetical protein